MRRLYQILAIQILVSIFLSHCSTNHDSIRIGVILPLTGELAHYGEAAKKGIELALEEINLMEQDNSFERMRVVYEDTRGDPVLGALVVQKLVRQIGVKAIIGDLFSSVTLRVAPIANKNKVVLLSPTSSSPKITEAGEYIFRNCVSDVFEVSKMVEFITKELNIRNVAVLYINNEYGIGTKRAFEKALRSHGGIMTISQKFEQGSSNFEKELIRIRESGSDAVYLVGYKELGHIITQAQEMMIHVRFLSTVMFEDPDILTLAGKAADGVIYTARDYDISRSDNPTKMFVDRFRHRFGEDPNIFSALSYDAMKLIYFSIQSGATSGEDIKNALLAVKNHPTVVGNISFDSNGDVIKPIVLKTVKNGKFQRIL